MDSYLDRKADFTRYLVERLGDAGPAALAERTGLLETTVRAVLAGAGELVSWEVAGACLAAAGAGAGELGEARHRWAAAEKALWDERGEGLRAAFEQHGHGKPTKVVEVHRPRVPWRRLTARHPVRFAPWAEPDFPADRKLPDPAGAADIRELYALLRDLRAWAGSPRQSEIEKRSWGTLPDATISAMLQRDRWRAASDRELVRVGYFAAACGLPDAEVARWVEAYERLRHVPPPDDLALARAEAAELRLRLDAVQAEADGLRARLAEAAECAPAPEPVLETADGTANGTAPGTGNGTAPGMSDGSEAIIGAAPDAIFGAGTSGFTAAGPDTVPGTAPAGGGSGGAGGGSGGAGGAGGKTGGGAGWSLRRRRTLSAAGAVLLFAAGAVTGAVTVRAAAGGDAACFSGTLHLVGSTAFERTAGVLRRGYEARCRDARVDVRAIGSNEGLRMLTRAAAGSAVAMHDGHLAPDSDEIRLRGFRGFPVAPIAFAVIVNKDTGVTGLSLRDMRAIYARDGGPASWRQVRGGADVPIRLVSRTEGSGTRTIFEERVLDEAEPELSSRDCRRKDELRVALRVVRCERSSQAQVLDTVNALPGTIGYAELHMAADARRYPNVRVLTLDGRRADASPATDHYPFVAAEVFYTYGTPPNGSPASAFLTFLASDRARELLRRAGVTPCLTADAEITPACQTG